MKPDSIRAQLIELWRPRTRREILEFCTNEIWMSERFTNRPGLYDPTFTSYLKPCHEWFGDPEVRTISAPKGAQIGFTTFLANALMWAISEDPGPALFLTSTSDNAQSWSEREWLPRLNDCKRIASLIPKNRDAMKKMEQAFLSMTVKLSGAQSENNLASRPIRYLLNDEVDKWPHGFLGIAEARTLSYRGVDKIVRGSTCTTEEGPIWMSWINSTQHLWNVECPVCKAPQVFDFFKSVKWSADHKDAKGNWNIEAVRQSAYGVCIVNGCEFSSSQRNEMVRAGQAVATNPHASPQDKGIHLPSLLSPFLSFADLAALWLQKKNTLAGKQDFYNQYLGLPWSHEEYSVSEEKVRACRAIGDNYYLLGECPIDPVDVTLSADVGEKATHWSVEAVAHDGQCYVVDYGTVLAVEDLLAIMRKDYPIKGSEKRVRITSGVVDSGYATERVYRACANSGGRLWPIKGSSAEFGKPVDAARIPTWPTLLLYTYVDFFHKVALYIDSIARRSSPLWWIPANVGNDFIEGHCGQELKSKQTAARSIKFWKPVANDHYGDCSKGHRIIRDVRSQYYGFGNT